MGKSMCCKGEAVKSDNVTHAGYIQAPIDEDAPYSLHHQHLITGLDAKDLPGIPVRIHFLIGLQCCVQYSGQTPAYTQLCLQWSWNFSLLLMPLVFMPPESVSMCCENVVVYYYYYYYSLEVWARHKTLLLAVLCTSYPANYCLPSITCSPPVPCRALCYLAMFWLQFRQKKSFYNPKIATFQWWNCFFLTR